ncbi:hypothetical protein [Paraburkholderia sp. J76]|uniref:hypothetical protein n=1 Tax=Paraburkholderia sp. J76 TaxID=2805439 RepID=UPI002ABE7BA5|nr:hypothetical protein [Paraburkholderia sp. J76]
MSQGNSNSSNMVEKFNAGTSFFNILVTIAIAIGGYKFVTEPQQQLNSAHTQTDDVILVAKFFNDIRPNIDFICEANQDGPATAQVICTEKNKGGQRILLDTPEVRLKRTDQDGFIDPRSYRITQSNENSLPVGATGNTSYKIEAIGVASVDWSKITVLTSEFAKTDPDVLSTLAGKLGSNLDGQQLDKLSVQSFGYTSPVTPFRSASPAQPASVPTLPASDSQVQ